MYHKIVHRFAILLVVLTIATARTTPVMAATPINDDFANAMTIGSLPFSDTVDITDATNEIGEPQICNYMDKSAWYSFTPSETTLVKADIQGSLDGSALDVFQAYGSDITSLGFMSCTANNSPFTFLALAGQTYYLQVGTTPDLVGTIQVHLEQIPPPINDDFANATMVGSLPFTTSFDYSGATMENSEPLPLCMFTSPSVPTIWYTYKASQDATLSADIGLGSSTSPFFGIYAGTSLNNLAEIGCGRVGNVVTFHSIAGQTYYFQIGDYFEEMGGGTFSLNITPPPVAGICFGPSDPSIFDNMQFNDCSSDPGQAGFQSFTWDFGDGTTLTTTNCCVNHQYAKDGDYTVQHGVTTVDGRSAATSQVVHVRTKDIAITGFSVPQTARVNQTKTINVNIQNKRYSDYVQVNLYKSVPASGDQLIGTLTIYVPAKAKQSTVFKFSYTFTSQDGTVGKVTFRAEATIVNGRDAYPSDNTAIATTKVNGGSYP